MRTKALVLTAATVAAGALSSMAQSNVYSLNVVGYVNVPAPAGYSLVTAQLQGANTSLATVIGTNLPSGLSVYKWIPAQQTLSSNPDSFYTAADLAGTGFPPGWYDSNNNPSTDTIALGESFFVLNTGSSTNLTFVGTVAQGTNSIAVGAGYSFVGLPIPVSIDVTTNSSLALPTNIEQLSVQTFNSATGNYNPSLTYYNAADLAGTGLPAGWYDPNNVNTPLVTAVGQGLVLLNSAAASTWTTTFTVQ